MPKIRINHHRPSVIYKYEIKPPQHDSFVCSVELPSGAQVIHIDSQEGKIFLWAIVDPSEHRNATRHYAVVPTGVTFASGPEYMHWSFLKTITVLGKLVFHIFDIDCSTPEF